MDYFSIILYKQNETVAKIDGETGAVMFGKGANVFDALGNAMFGNDAHRFLASGSFDIAKSNLTYDNLLNLLTVRGKFESNKDGNRIVIDPEGRSIKMFDQEDNEVFNVSFSVDEEYGFTHPKVIIKGGSSFYKQTVKITTSEVLVYTGETSSSDKTTCLGHGSMYVWEKEKGFIGISAYGADGKPTIRMIDYQTGATRNIQP